MMQTDQIPFTVEPCLRGRAVAVKRDMELVRAILLKIEAKDNLRPETIRLDGYDEATVGRHIEMLFDLGLIEGVPHRTTRDAYKPVLVTDLSWAGHEFVAATRNNTVWARLKQNLGDELPKLPLELVKELATKMLGQVLSGQLGS